MVGGRNGIGKGKNSKIATVQRAEIINLEKGQALDGPQGGPNQADHVAVNLKDGRVLLAGGSKEPPGMVLAETMLYETASGGRWITGAQLPEPRSLAAAVLLPDGKAVVLGGENATGPSQRALLFNGATFISSANSQAIHREHAAASTRNGALVAGGADTKQVEMFDGGQFQQMGELVKKRQRFTLTPLPDGTIMAIGGHESGAARVDVELFNPR